MVGEEVHVNVPLFFCPFRDAAEESIFLNITNCFLKFNKFYLDIIKSPIIFAPSSIKNIEYGTEKENQKADGFVFCTCLG